MDARAQSGVARHVRQAEQLASTQPLALSHARLRRLHRLPDASKGAPHIRDVFTRMGFNDQELVALSGAHALGRCAAACRGGPACPCAVSDICSNHGPGPSVDLCA